MHPSLSIERLNHAQPILAPTDLLWENDGTINAAAIYLPDGPILRGLLDHEAVERAETADTTETPDGAVAVIYRAIARQTEDFPIPVSSAGLALFTPEMQLLRRFNQPILFPGTQPADFDSLGIEDPRITCLDDTFYMLYCGPTPDPTRTVRTRLCLAASKDLLHWEKHGPIPGGPDRYDNKDGVLFPETIAGKYFLLHRPWGEEIGQQNYQIWLASAVSPLGPWKEHGPILAAIPNPAFHSSWVGAGSVPIPLGDKRYLVIYHTGNFTTPLDRRYDAAAAIFDFNHFDGKAPAAVVTSRLEPFMYPETPAELNQTPAGHSINVIFPCGTYIYKDDLYMIYGAGDKNTCAARVNLAALVSAVG